MKATIITIGDEILIGQIVDTNSAWLSAELNKQGIEVLEIKSIADSPREISTTLDNVSSEADLVFMTGGLGPTKDDITKKTLADWFHTELVTDAQTLETIRSRFMARGLEVPASSFDQALVPKMCTVLRNSMGSAPGMWFTKDKTHYFSMPGVPFEMKAIFSEEITPILTKFSGAVPIVHKTVMTQGVGESKLMGMIGSWEEGLSSANLKLAYLPSVGSVRLRVSGKGIDARQRVDQKVNELIPLIENYVYGFDDQPIESAIGELLAVQGLTISTAESCTGGYIAHLLTSVSGSSQYFEGSVVSYSNNVKKNQLGVDPEMLKQHGAVSEQVAKQMAAGVMALLGTDIGVATTGIAGPTGGSDAKPVGTVWIAIASKRGVEAELFRMGNQRNHNIRRTALQALQMVRKQILEG